MTRGKFAKISQEICKFCIIVCTAPPHEFHTPKKKISYHSPEGVDLWGCQLLAHRKHVVSASLVDICLIFISLCLLRAFVAWWPETPPPLRTPQSPADGRPGSRSLSRAVASSMKLYRACHLCIVIIYYLLFLVPAGHRI